MAIAARTAAEVDVRRGGEIRAATGARVLAVTADVSCEADLIAWRAR